MIKKTKHINLWRETEIKTENPRVFNAVIEIPKGSTYKYEIDEKTGFLYLDRELKKIFRYPANYGFLPKTLWYDNDPLDILVVSKKALPPLCITKVKIIGALKVIDEGKKDDKIIAIPYKNSQQKIDSLKDIKEKVSEIKEFFNNYKKPEGKKCKVLRVFGYKTALEYIKIANKTYEKRFKKKKFK